MRRFLTLLSIFLSQLVVPLGLPAIELYNEDFESYDPGSNLSVVSSSNWSPVSPDGMLTIVADEGHVFSGETNQYGQLTLADAADPITIYAGKSGLDPSLRGQFRIEFHDPSTAAHVGYGWGIRLKSGAGGNAATAFAVFIQNGELIRGNGPPVNPGEIITTYNFDTVNLLEIVYNNGEESYSHEGETVAPNSMDVYLNGVLVGNDLGGCGGIGTGVSLNGFDITAKSWTPFSGMLYIDNLSIHSETVDPIDTSGLSFVSDWESDPQLGGWGAKQVMEPGRLQRDSNVQTWHGKDTARIEVWPGDDPINSSGERSEVLWMRAGNGQHLTENWNSGTQYYGMSYFLPEDWVSAGLANGQYGWSIVFQLHGPDSLVASPSFALHANRRYQVTTNGGNLDLSVKRGWFDFTDGGDLNLGKWTDFILRITWSPLQEGNVTVWRRNEGDDQFTLVLQEDEVATLQYRSPGGVQEHYWKHGLYRNISASLTNILWAGPVSRANTFNAAEEGAFGTAVGAPFIESWGGYLVLDSHINTDDWLGWLYPFDRTGWFYAYSLGKGVYIQEPLPDSKGTWIYIHK